jgi:hypothetical protein
MIPLVKGNISVPGTPAMAYVAASSPERSVELPAEGRRRPQTPRKSPSQSPPAELQSPALLSPPVELATTEQSVTLESRRKFPRRPLGLFEPQQ